MLLPGIVNSRHAFQKEIGSPGTQRGQPSSAACSLDAPAASSAVICLQHQN